MQKRILLFLPVFALMVNILPAQTLSSVEEVYQIFQAKCVSCHDHASPEGGLDLEGTGANNAAKALYVAQKLNNINPTNAYAISKGYKRIYPGRPDRSFLLRKINNGFESTIDALHTEEGAAMPTYPNTGSLSDVEKEIIRQWIVYGAKTSGVLFDKTLVENFYNIDGEKSFPDGPPPAPAPGEGFQVKMGPFFLAPDGEVQYYQKYELNLPADVEVNRLDIKISPFSHHFIVYNFTGSGANSIPAGLRLDANHSQISLVAAVQEQTDLLLPATTAFKWDQNLVLDLNSHYINYSLIKPFQCEAYINVYTQPQGTAQQEMFATLLVNPNIPIPNNGNLTTYTKPEFQFGADSIYVWGLMGHTHKYGTGYKVWKRLANGQKGEQIYDAGCPLGVPGCAAPSYDYQHIPLRYWEPSLPIKWSNGIIHEAEWVNDGPSSVNFGPTSDDEMMVLIAFYTLFPITTATEEPIDKSMRTPVQVMPNPANDRISVVVPGTNGVRRFRIFDATGRLVTNLENISGNTFDLQLAGFIPGMYWFNADGNTGKFVVE